MASETFTSLVILELSPATEKETLEWFVNRLTMAPIDAGAGLIVHVVESVRECACVHAF